MQIPGEKGESRFAWTQSALMGFVGQDSRVGGEVECSSRSIIAHRVSISSQA